MKADDPLRIALESIEKRTSQQRTSVQLLGRYNHSKPKDLPTLKRDFPNLNIEFLTVHGSKVWKPISSLCSTSQLADTAFQARSLTTLFFRSFLLRLKHIRTLRSDVYFMLH